MKTVLVWNPLIPSALPARLNVADTVAFALAAAGVATAADPNEAGVIAAGAAALAPILSTPTAEIVLDIGRGLTARLRVPEGVAAIAVGAGVGAVVGGGQLAGVVTPTLPPTPLPGLVGFYANGATNTKLKAGFARVNGGTGRAKMVIKCDSTGVGQWAVEDGNDGLTNARLHRPAAKLAALYTAAGIPMLDNSVIGDPAFMMFNRGFPTETSRYDPRVSYRNAQSNGNASFAGAAVLYIDVSGYFSFNTTDVDTFVMSAFGAGSGAMGLTIDGAAPAIGPASLNLAAGPPYLVGATIKAASVGPHSAAFVTPSTGGGNVSGIYAYNSAVAAWDIIMHGNNGATSASQSASNGQWFTQERLAFDAPDLTKINLGLNDQTTGVSLATYTSNVQAIITEAKKSGDVLLMFPSPCNTASAIPQSDYNAAAKALAATNGVAFLSLFEHFGGPPNSAFVARTHDGVHPNDGLYTDIAAAEKQAIDLMRAA